MKSKKNLIIINLKNIFVAFSNVVARRSDAVNCLRTDSLYKKLHVSVIENIP